MYHQTFRDRLFKIWLWIRYLGWMYLIAVVGLVVIGYGAYMLAAASPVVKLSIALGGVLLYNFTGLIWKHLPIRVAENGGVRSGISCLLAVVMFVAIYALFLSAFLVGWPISVTISVGLIFAIVLVVLDKKKVKIPASVIWARNGIFIFTILGLSYYLAKYLGL